MSEHRHIDVSACGFEHARVPFAADPVEYHPGDLHIVAERGETMEHGRRAGGLASDLDDQHDGYAEHGGQIGGGSGAVGRAVEQAITPSPITKSASAEISRMTDASVVSRMAHGSRLRHGRPPAAA